MAKTIQVTLNGKTPIRDIVDEITYRSYAYNRQRSPDIKSEDWAWVFIDAKRFEERFQSEVADKAAAPGKSHDT